MNNKRHPNKSGVFLLCEGVIDMKVLVRKTLTGNEYWDSETQRILFVPAGEEPNFEVGVSIIVAGLDLASGKDQTVIDGQAVAMGEQTKRTANDVADSFESIAEGINLEDLNAEQLRSFAEHSNINVPGNMKKEETIRKYIEAALIDATDAE